MTYPTDSTHELMSYAIDTLHRLFHEGYSYRRAAVTFFGLVPADQLTLLMFGDPRRERFRKVLEAVDAINRKYGQTLFASPSRGPTSAGRRSSNSARLATRHASQTSLSFTKRCA